MTLAPTHFTLQGIILWEIMRKTDREYFLENKPWMILLLNIIANLPDLDDRIGFHRGPVHSLFLALASLIVTGLLYHHYKKSAERNATSLRRWRIIIYAEIMWLLHILLDMNTPLALFWPLTDQLYVVNFVLLISIFPVIVLGILLLPYEILGLSLDVQTESFIQGLKFYLTNLTVEERKQLFPEILAVPIFDFVLHVLVAIAWILIVGRSLAKAFWHKYLSARWTRWKGVFWKNLIRTMKDETPWTWILLTILVAFSGLILTNDGGPQTQIPISVQEEFKITPMEFSPFHILTYERLFQLIPPASPDVEITYAVTPVAYTNVTNLEFWMIALPIPTVEELGSALTSLYENASSDGNFQVDSFQASYKNVLLQAIPLEYRIHDISSNENNVSGTFTPPVTEKMFNFGIIIWNWSLSSNEVNGFSVVLNMHYVIIQHQEGIYYFGTFLQVASLIIIIILCPVRPVLKTIMTVRRGKNEGS